MTLKVSICYLSADGDPVIITREEDANGAGIITEEVYTRGFDDGELTVAPEQVLFVLVKPT